MAFYLSGKLVSLHLDNSTAKAYLYNHGGTVSPFLSRLACQILSLTDTHGITLIPAYIPTHLNVEADYLSQGCMFPECHLLLQVAQAAFPLWAYQRWICWYHPIHSMPVLLHLVISTTSGDLGVECLQQSLKVSGKLCVSFSHISSSSSVQVSDITYQRSTQKFDSDGTFLMEAPWLPTVLNMFADIPQQHFIIKDLVMDVSVGHVFKVLPYLHLTLWLLRDVCYVGRVLFLSLSGSGGGNLSIYIKGPPAVLEGIGQLVCLRGHT